MVQLFEPEGQGAADSNITAGVDSNEEAPVSRTDTTVISYILGGGESDENNITWASPQLNNADMPSGTYRAGVECSAIGANSSYKIQISRYQSGDVRDEILHTGASQSATGPQIENPTLDPAAGATGDRIVMEILATRPANHGNETTSMTVNDADSLIEVPFDPPVSALKPWDGPVPSPLF